MPFEPLARALRALVIALVAIMTAALALQIALRYVTNHALSWSEELALACFTWSTLLAVALGVRSGMHVRMDLLLERLSGLPRLLVERLILLMIASFGAFVAWAGWHYVEATRGSTSAAIGYPIATLYVAAPVAGALIALFAIERAWRMPAILAAEAATAEVPVEAAAVGAGAASTSNDAGTVR